MTAGTDASEEIEPKSQAADRPNFNWIGYVIPMGVYMAFTGLEGRFTGASTAIYAAKLMAVTAALLAFRRPLREIRFDAGVLIPAVLVGLAVFIEWIVVDPLTPHFGFLGKRPATNPFAAFPDPLQRLLYLTIRFYGLAVLVPIMEEIFWRSFLLRWITRPEFDELPLGTYNPVAFAAVAIFFGFEHQEWLAAILCACAYGLLLQRTRSLFACIVAHGVTNLTLGIYVLATGQWHYW